MERSAYYAQRSEAIETAMCSGDPTIVHNSIKHALPKPYHHTQHVTNNMGHISTNIVETQQHFQEYFGDLLNGTVITYSELVDRHRLKLSHNSTHQHIPITATIFLSQSQIAFKFAKLKPKAVGESGLGGELFAAAPETLAKAYFPLTTKAMLHCHTPLQWDGGQLFSLFKGKGEKTDRTNYRDLTITDISCKHFMSSLRSQLSPSLQQATIPTQFGGGCNGGSTTIAHLLAKAQVEHGLTMHRMCIRLFVDV